MQNRDLRNKEGKMIKKNIQRNKNTNNNDRSDSQYEEIEENEGFRRRNHKMYYFNKNNFFSMV